MSNSLDPDGARCLVRPDLGLNCLHRLSVDDNSRQRANSARDITFNLYYMLNRLS